MTLAGPRSFFTDIYDLGHFLPIFMTLGHFFPRSFFTDIYDLEGHFLPIIMTWVSGSVLSVKTDSDLRSVFQGHYDLGNKWPCLRSLFPEKVTLGKATCFQGHNDLEKLTLGQSQFLRIKLTH